MLPKVPYGHVASPINETATRQLRTAIANCITFVTSRRSTDLTFAMASRGADVDPDVEAITRRMTMIRRMMSKDGKVNETIKEIYAKYCEQGEPGCQTEYEVLKNKHLGG